MCSHIYSSGVAVVFTLATRVVATFCPIKGVADVVPMETPVLALCDVLDHRVVCTCRRVAGAS